MDAIYKKVSLKLQVGVIDTQDNINIKLKAEGVDNINKIKTIIKKGVQAALKELKEYQVLNFLFFYF